MKIKFVKTHPNAKLPCKSSPERDDPLTGDTGYDIFAVEDTLIPARGSKVVAIEEYILWFGMHLLTQARSKFAVDVVWQLPNGINYLK